MFDNLLQNISTGFGVVKDKFKSFGRNVNTGTQVVGDNFNDAISYSRDVFNQERKNPVPSNIPQQVVQQQNRRDIKESTSSLMEWFNNYQQKEADRGNFSLFNLGKLPEKASKDKDRKREEDKMFQEGIFEKSDMSNFGPGLKGVGERTAGNVYDMLVAPVLRSGLALTNEVQKGLDTVGEKIGIDPYLAEEGTTWTKQTLDILEETDPSVAEKYKTFFGLKEEQENVNLETVGKEWAELIEMTGLKVDPKYLPAIGLMGSLLDVIPGFGGGKNAVVQATKNSKNVDEFITVLKSFSKGSDEDITKLANELFANKDATPMEIAKIIETAEKSDSTIKFLADGESLEKNIERVVTEQSRKLLDETENVIPIPSGSNLDNLVDEAGNLQEMGFQPKLIDDVGEGIALIDETETELRQLIDGIKRADLPEGASTRARELKEIFNQGTFDELTLTQRLKAIDFFEEISPLVKETKGEMVDLLNYYQKIDQGLIQEMRALDKNALDEFGKQFTEGLTVSQNKIASGITGNNYEDAISGAIQATQYKNIAGKVLNVVGEIKAKVPETKVQQRLSEAVNYFTKEGKTQEEIVSIFKNGAKDKGKNLSELTASDIESIFGNNIPTNFGALLEMYRYTNMLSNVTTQSINTMSNATENAVVRPIVETIASALEFLGIKGTGREIGDVGTYFKGLVNSPEILSRATKKAIDVFNEVDDMRHIDIDRVPQELKIAGVDVAKIYRIPLRALEAGDAFMYEVVRQLEMDKIMSRSKYKGRTLTITERNAIQKEVEMIAEDAIFRVTKDNPMHGAISQFTNMLADVVKSTDKMSSDFIKKVTGAEVHPLKWVMPFVNTISRLSAKQLRRIPVVGAIEMIGGKDKAGVVADQIFGATMTYVGYSLYKNNKEAWKLDRGPSGSPATSYSDDEGNQYNSINISENQWVELEALGPGAGPIFFGAKIAQAEEEGRFDFGDKKLVQSALQFIGVVGSLMAKEGLNSLDQKFMSSALDLPEMVRDPQWKQVSNTLRQFIPYSSGMGAINRAFFDNEKKITPQSFNEALEFMIKDIPGLSQNLTQKTDRDGIPLFYGNEDKSIGEGVNELLNPGRPKVRDQNIHNKYLQEKERADLRSVINEETGKTDIEGQNDLDMIQNIINNTIPNGMEAVYKERINELGQAGVVDLVNEFENRNESQGSRFIDDILKGRGTPEAKEFIKSSSPEEIEAYVKEYETKETGRLKLIVEKIMLGRGTDAEKEALKTADPTLLQKAIKSYENSLEL